jgi:tripartite ATP-independent transporter DctM subunit
VITAFLFLSFLTLLFVGVPIAMAIGVAVLLSMSLAGYSDHLFIMPQQIVDGVNNPALLAVPFFILAGNLMNAAGMTDRIFNFAMALVGHFRAGLAQVNVLASMLFAGISGAAVADIAGLGTVQVKAMRERGYSVEFAAALSVASSVVGPIIPPSIGLVIYAVLSNTSVARLFLGGVLPGLLIGVALMTFNYVMAHRYGVPREVRATLRHVMRTGVDGTLALVAPGLIVGALITGYATTMEAGVIACGYSLLLGLLYRSLTWTSIWFALTQTTLITAIILIIIGISQAMAWLLAIERVPQQLAEAVLLTTDNRYVFLALLLLFLLSVGLVVESIPALLILTPMLLPIIDTFGIDRVHFGLIIVFALLIGIATPPVGMGLYIMSKVANISFERMAWAILPLLVPLITVLLLIAYIPGLVLWLPGLIMGN